MDEDRRLRVIDAALDRLALGEALLPSDDPIVADALDLAQAIRELGDPEWPEDEDAFLARLMPPSRSGRAAWAWPGAAAAALLALLLARLPAPVAVSIVTPSVAAVSQRGALHTSVAFATAAPSATPKPAKTLHGTAVLGTTDAHGAPVQIILGGDLGQVKVRPVWLADDVLALSAPAAPVGGSVAVHDLTGHERRISASASRGVELLRFSGLAPGWYRLPRRYGLAVLLPMPPGAAAQGRLRLARDGQATGLPGVRLISLDLGERGVAANLVVPTPAAAKAIALASPQGAQRPVHRTVRRVPGGYQASLLFDPVPEGTPELELLAPGPAGGWTPIKTVRLSP